MRKQRVEPLYRKVNTKARGVRHYSGSDYKHTRGAKNQDLVKMKSNVKRGLDYTPLFKFLLKHVGSNWDEVFSKASNRLDDPKMVYHMVALNKEEGVDYFRGGDCSNFSGLYVDKNGLLQKVNPEIDHTSYSPSCACCTHTFNGILLSQKCKF